MTPTPDERVKAMARAIRQALDAEPDCYENGVAQQLMALPEAYQACVRFVSSSEFLALAAEKARPVEGGDGLIDNLLGPHEWGYRDLTDGSFIADDAPYRAGEALLAASAPPVSEGVGELVDVLKPFALAHDDVIALRERGVNLAAMSLSELYALAAYRLGWVHLAAASRALAAHRAREGGKP